jgi:hypothetical protein
MPKSSHFIAGIAIGVAVFASFGAAFDHMGLGALAGVAVGVVIAFVLARIAANSL